MLTPTETGTAPPRINPTRAFVVGLAALSIELWLRRDSRFPQVSPGAFALYVVFALSLFASLALVLEFLVVLAGSLLNRLRPASWLAVLPPVAIHTAFIACVTLVPIALKHVGLRYLIRPDTYTSALLATIAVISLSLSAGAYWLSNRPTVFLSVRWRTRCAVVILMAPLVVGRTALELSQFKLIALENTHFSGLLTAFVLRTLDFDRDGFPGEWATGADTDDFDAGVNLFTNRRAVDPDFGTGRGLAPFGESPAGPTRDTNPPNIILITLDTFAYGHTGPAGYHRPTTPVLNFLAGKGMWFENCFVPIGQSAASYASILSGTYPHVHRVLAGEWNKVPDVPYLWPRFDATYDTLVFAYTRESQLSPGASRFADGAQKLLMADDYVPEPPELFDWITEERRRPFFLWLFSKVLHSPHHLPAELDIFRGATREPLSRFQIPRRQLLELGDASRGRMIDAYDSALLYADSTIGALWSLLERNGLSQRTVIVVTGDHGEAFFDHDRVGHGQEVYDEHLRVPLLIVGPGVTHGRSQALVSSIDILPTLLELGQVERTKEIEGRSLVPALHGATLQSYPALFLVGGYGTFGFPYYDKVAVRTSDYKFILDPVLNIAELYDLRSDPLELDNIVDAEPERRSEMFELLRRWPGFYPMLPPQSVDVAPRPRRDSGWASGDDSGE